MYRVIFGLAAAVGAHGVALAQTPPPASAFARLPAVVEAEISPNGQNVALLGGAPTARSVSITGIDRGNLNVLRLGDVETLSIRWAGDQYVLARMAAWDKTDPRRDYRFVRTAVVSPEAKFVSVLLQGDDLSSMLLNQTIEGVVLGAQPRVIVRGLTLAAGPERNMNTRMARKGENDIRVAALFSVDPATGRGVQVERGDFDVAGWELDLAGQPRVMFKVDELTQRRRTYGRAKGETRWTLIQDGDDGRSFLGYSDADDRFYFAVAGPEGHQVVRQALPDGKPEPVGRPSKDSSVSLIWDTHRNAVVGVRGGAQVDWLDPTLAATAATLDRAFKDKRWRFGSWSQDLTRFIVSVDGADEPGEWFLYDRPRKELSPVGEAYPELASASLGRTSFFRYKARDGLEIPAFLTLPPGASAGAKPPLIVLPHGGPAANDGDGFDYLVQFLATRGYAVLRPQYRGSTGFGPAFLKAGEGEWGGKMQTDLLDGVAAVADQGVDTTRVCIVGASFGGFSALSGAVFHAPAYRCAASINGMADLRQQVADIGTDFGRDSSGFQAVRERLLAASPEGVDRISPLKNAERAAAPVLLIHGDRDTTVSPEHSARMAAALKRAGKPVEHVVLTGETHGIATTPGRQKLLETLEGFLAKHLPVSRP